jgi:hypothetical protein
MADATLLQARNDLQFTIRPEHGSAHGRLQRAHFSRYSRTLIQQRQNLLVKAVNLLAERGKLVVHVASVNGRS